MVLDSICLDLHFFGGGWENGTIKAFEPQARQSGHGDGTGRLLQIPCEVVAASKRVGGGTPTRTIDFLKEHLGNACAARTPRKRTSPWRN
jgi:hypothetical protein